MKVLICGGAGYLGGTTTDFIEDRHFQVRVVDLLLFEEIFHKDVHFYHLDVRDHTGLLPHLEWADCVVWLAAIVGDGACALSPEVATAVNAESVKWLTKVYKKRIIFPSTCSVYGAQDKLLDESAPTKPLSVYAKTKLQAEKYLANSDALILRLGTLYGLGDRFSRIRTDLVVNTLTVQACMKGEITINGGDQWRPLTHVQDVARLIASQLDTPHRGIYNVAGCNMQIKQLGKLLKESFPTLRIKTVPMYKKDAWNYRVSSDKAGQELGWDAVLNPTNGIQELQAMIRQGRIPDPFNPRFNNERALEAKHGE